MNETGNKFMHLLVLHFCMLNAVSMSLILYAGNIDLYFSLVVG